MSKSLVSAFHIKPNNSLILNDYDIFQDKELLEKLKHLVSFPTEIRVDLDKLEKLRDINLKSQQVAPLPEKTKPRKDKKFESHFIA